MVVRVAYLVGQPQGGVVHRGQRCHQDLHRGGASLGGQHGRGQQGCQGREGEAGLRLLQPALEGGVEGAHAVLAFLSRAGAVGSAHTE